MITIMPHQRVLNTTGLIVYGARIEISESYYARLCREGHVVPQYNKHFIKLRKYHLVHRKIIPNVWGETCLVSSYSKVQEEEIPFDDAFLDEELDLIEGLNSFVLVPEIYVQQRINAILDTILDSDNPLLEEDETVQKFLKKHIF